MSSLTSTQINNTYPGLLKLEDSTSGLTNSFQTIQDGLGNNLPLKVKDGQIQGQNIFSFGYFVPDYEGTGFINTAGQFPAGSQNKLVATAFYNPGLNSFSAITYRVQTATTSSDTAELAFYNTQFVPGLGLQPKDLIMSGINLDTASTGLKTTALPSTLSFSAYGSGIYFAVIKISNSGVQPTIRYAQGMAQSAMSQYTPQLGFSFEASGAHLITPIKQSSTNATANAMVYNSLANFQTSFSSGDFSGGVLSATFVGLGFGLNVIK
jgi:hypothetical protein